MAQPKRVGHLVVNVSDQDASTKFYTEVLGFEISVERPGFGTFLTCGKIHHVHGDLTGKEILVKTP